MHFPATILLGRCLLYGRKKRNGKRKPTGLSYRSDTVNRTMKNGQRNERIEVMEQLGFWELVHGTSAGCASIVAFESMREFCHGPGLLAIYGVVTVSLFKFQQWHLAKVRARKMAKAQAEVAS